MSIVSHKIEMLKLVDYINVQMVTDGDRSYRKGIHYKQFPDLCQQS